MDIQLDSIYALISLYAVKIVIAIAIFFVGKFIAKRVVRLTQTLMRKSKIEETLVVFAGNILYALAVTFVVIAALSQLGINTTSLAAAVAAAGLAIGLALQGSLSNLAAGVMIILFKPFKMGDYVEASNIGGTVEEISIFTTKFRTPDNKTIIVPNGSITSGHIINYSTKPTRRVDLVFGVSYDADLKRVKQVLADIIAEDERILKEPEPVIAVLSLGADSVNIAVRPWVNTAHYWDVHFDLHEKVKMIFDKDGIGIPFPQRDIHLKLSDVESITGKDKKKAA